MIAPGDVVVWSRTEFWQANNVLLNMSDAVTLERVRVSDPTSLVMLVTRVDDVECVGWTMVTVHVHGFGRLTTIVNRASLVDVENCSFYLKKVC